MFTIALYHPAVVRCDGSGEPTSSGARTDTSPGYSLFQESEVTARSVQHVCVFICFGVLKIHFLKVEFPCGAEPESCLMQRQ